MLTLRASEIGGCPRFLYLKAHGDDLELPDAGQMRVFQAGIDAEVKILEYACKGMNILSTQLEGSIKTDGVTITGHCDALCEDAFGERVVVEAKLMSKERFARASTGDWSDQILDQVACYAKMFDASLVVLAAQKKDSDECLLDTLERAAAETRFDRLRSRVRAVRDALAHEDRSMTPQKPGEFGCLSCPTRFHCYPRWRPWYAIGEEGDQACKLMQSYRTMTAARNQLEAELEEIKGKLAGMMEPHDTDVLKCMAGTVRWVEGQERLSLSAAPEGLREQLRPYMKRDRRSLRLYMKKAGDDGVSDDGAESPA